MMRTFKMFEEYTFSKLMNHRLCFFPDTGEINLGIWRDIYLPRFRWGGFGKQGIGGSAGGVYTVQNSPMGASTYFLIRDHWVHWNASEEQEHKPVVW